jgi:S-adenosylmethionine synthetase
MADQISDAILDSVLAQDPNGRVGCETLVTTGTCIVAGEITTIAQPDVAVVRRTIETVGYTDAAFGFDWRTCGVHNLIQTQSPDIAMGVETGGAGDQGMMCGGPQG